MWSISKPRSSTRIQWVELLQKNHRFNWINLENFIAPSLAVTLKYSDFNKISFWKENKDFCSSTLRTNRLIYIPLLSTRRRRRHAFRDQQHLAFQATPPSLHLLSRKNFSEWHYYLRVWNFTLSYSQNKTHLLNCVIFFFFKYEKHLVI